MIGIDPNFPYALNVNDFEVRFISQSAPDYFKRAKVVIADDNAKTITVKFGGALSGKYDTEITHS